MNLRAELLHMRGAYVAEWQRYCWCDTPTVEEPGLQADLLHLHRAWHDLWRAILAHIAPAQNGRKENR